MLSAVTVLLSRGHPLPVCVNACASHIALRQAHPALAVGLMGGVACLSWGHPHAGCINARVRHIALRHCMHHHRKKPQSLSQSILAAILMESMALHLVPLKGEPCPYPLLAKSLHTHHPVHITTVTTSRHCSCLRLSYLPLRFFTLSQTANCRENGDRPQHFTS
jgi:hypothetical protein